MIDQQTPSLRDAALARLRTPVRTPVLIVGGGINGVGAFRELALQGVPAILLDKGDICAGASAAPSRLIHGGIKYLETGEFRLVAQSTLERNLLLRNAPHYVRPLPTYLPIQSWFGGLWPSLKRFLGRSAKIRDRGVVVTEAGLCIYDVLGLRSRVMPLHRMFMGKRAHARFPDMTPSIIALGRYYDAAISQPERLGLECVTDAIRACPDAIALNHVDITGVIDDTVHARDRVTGQMLAIKADVIINAGGAWIDTVNQTLGLETAYIGGTKGSHLVLDHPELLRELDGAMVYFGVQDGRICLAYPFFGHVMVGSTDIHTDAPDDAICTQDEQDYMLRALGELFPSLGFDNAQVVYRYAGVRPLPRSQTDNPGDISRDHLIHTDQLPGGTAVLSLVGGKWTTFRGLSEEVGTLVLSRLGRARTVGSRDIPIGGGRDFPRSPVARARFLDALRARFSLPAERAATLLERYGSLAIDIATFCSLAGDEPLTTLPDYTRREIAFIARRELVGHLADVLFRRTTLALEGRLTPAVIADVAAVVSETLGWSAERRDDEANWCWRHATERHGVRNAYRTGGRPHLSIAS
ncbi:glycerol-3-phosphate dehydrogenase [Ameyamaea chiangmaiensis NBRC 103196]|uniref:Glycerol-3-phosphate dehydrogenase/oxidase n=1 Tax=Ameyamaea chiangmaiensis TaxID=442969 RepID=A0A850P893_9PROT|nr:glycerol-3-phosphate dehydrogenase/oxidase [Ameyamaea chiangmaiensis]MBS4075935.1 glycerol-3-phosphate dehydrogenase/oxidase [Ameyamaea chiangmaiensis]NVN40184.1 glycerol-3-phosphate dehydrogenase/oxidase [Ameyamaea chiangmaiensis]GBQ61681.1 glycerol-3-phosphate dehydrogenase [Ameyamaea chiangmaiensis NBRC 103196]